MLDSRSAVVRFGRREIGAVLRATRVRPSLKNELAAIYDARELARRFSQPASKPPPRSASVPGSGVCVGEVGPSNIVIDFTVPEEASQSVPRVAHTATVSSSKK